MASAGTTQSIFSLVRQVRELEGGALLADQLVDVFADLEVRTYLPAPCDEPTETDGRLTVAQAADLAGVSEKTIRRSIGSGDLGHRRYRNAIRISPADLDAWGLLNVKESRADAKTVASGLRPGRTPRTQGLIDGDELIPSHRATQSSKTTNKRSKAS
jgi:excisionase family DNA binding protein